MIITKPPPPQYLYCFNNFSFKDRDIITNRIAKLFKGNKELKHVYEALLIIIGLEHFESDDSSQEIQKLENMVWARVLLRNTTFIHPRNRFQDSQSLILFS